MGYVSETKCVGDSLTSTLIFEKFEDFLKYEGRFEEGYETTPSRKIAFTEKEYYYLCILVGHLKPGGNIVRSLLYKFDLNLDCEDYDKLIVESELGCNVLKLDEEGNVL